MPDSKFNAKDALADYVTVPERVKLFYELFGQGRLVTGEVRLTTEPDGKPRVMVQAAAYRNPEDLHPGIGWSWMELPGTTSFTRGSELENTETSAWGRAIAALGILVDRSIASVNEIQNKANEGAKVRQNGDDGLTGTVALGTNDADMNLRQTPDDGFRIGFKLTSPNGGIKVMAFSPLAEQIEANKAKIVGARVTCWGRITDESYTPKPKPGAKEYTVTYQVLTLERIRVPDVGDLPRVEAAPVFSADEEERIERSMGPDNTAAGAEHWRDT